ncbi:MAG TPA: LPS export ABC transporter periplasmic protein LptC [Burkholderiales bacterium]|nr:LPS export ABC transporter periplasmic protein LptC [Burkholderiales bacterium]
MGDRFGGWFPLALLAMVAGLTFWLDHVMQPPADARGERASGDPDYIVGGLAAVRMDEKGHVQHTLHAQKMTHYPDGDVTLLVEPRFVTYAEGRTPVTVTSRRARVSGNGENVYFEDAVRVTRAPYGNRSELVLETSYLHVIPDDNIAKTDRPVTIRDATAVVNATGLELNSETRVLRLDGRVKGIFDQRGPVNGR